MVDTDPAGSMRRTHWSMVLATGAEATLIADDADGGNGGVTIFGGAFKDMVARAGTGGASGTGLMTMSGRGGNYADLARAILNNSSRHPMGPLWCI